jgi:hypothetical protein
MNLPNIRTIEDINGLITKRYIESEIFDFKRNSGALKCKCRKSASDVTICRLGNLISMIQEFNTMSLGREIGSNLSLIPPDSDQRASLSINKSMIFT